MITHDEARNIAQRFIDGHFKNEGKERPRISIPCDTKRDDDCLLLEYIDQRESDQSIGNLLAVIHRDGGQYYQKNGLEKSCHDAESIVVRLRMDAKLMADALESVIDAGFSFSPATLMAIERARN